MNPKVQPNRNRNPLVGITIALVLAVSGAGSACDDGPTFDPFRDVEDVAALDAQSLFTFAIFSDNKGTGPDSGIAMAGMVDGVDESTSGTTTTQTMPRSSSIPAPRGTPSGTITSR